MPRRCGVVAPHRGLRPAWGGRERRELQRAVQHVIVNKALAIEPDVSGVDEDRIPLALSLREAIRKLTRGTPS